MAPTLPELSDQLDKVANMALDTLSASDIEEEGLGENGALEEELRPDIPDHQERLTHYHEINEDTNEDTNEDIIDTTGRGAETPLAHDLLRKVLRRLAGTRGEREPLLPLHDPDYSNYNPFDPSRRFQLVPFLMALFTRCTLASGYLQKHMGTALFLVFVVIGAAMLVLYLTGTLYIACVIAKAILCYIVNSLMDGTGAQVC